MNMIPMSMLKFMNHLQPEWSRFVTAAKQERDLHVANFDQLYDFLKQNEKYAIEVREMRQRFPNPLALLANTYNPPPSYSRVKDSEWFKDKTLLAQAQETRVVLHEEQQEFLADRLEENDVCDALQLHTTTHFKTDHVDAYDSDCVDQATANAIFMANLSSAGSLNNDKLLRLMIPTHHLRSKLRSNSRNDRILRPSRRSKKNKVEAQPRKFKSSSNKNNHVSDYNANIKNVALSKNSVNVCLSCNECLFSANHDACVFKYLKGVQKRKKAKSVEQKEKIKWKPAGRIFKTVSLKCIPTGRIINLVGKQCPPSKNTSTIVIPPLQILTTTVILIDKPCPKLGLRYANASESLSRSFLNFDIHPINLYDFGFERILSNKELPP
nr:hypothetical protein [Tanacetum cinerariifolium]